MKKLRSIFDTALGQFAKQELRLKLLENELEQEKKKFDKTPELCSWADEWLQRVSYLYHVNNQRIKFKKESEEFKKLDADLINSIGDIEDVINSENEYCL